MQYSKIKNIYIHIPFCVKKCLYCDFPVYALGKCSSAPTKTHQESIINNYLTTLKKEINIELTNLANQDKLSTLQTLYFGGGTPSLL